MSSAEELRAMKIKQARSHQVRSQNLRDQGSA